MRWPTLLAPVAGILFALAAPVRAADEGVTEAVPAAGAEAEAPPLEGRVLERADGGYIQITMKDQRFVLRFFDEKRKPVPPDVDRAVMRLLPAGRDPERFILSKLHDEMSLTHGPPVRAPHVFKVFLGLFRGDSADAVESYSTNFP